jgi:hypothetical protein
VPLAEVSELARIHAGVNLDVAQLRLQAGLPISEPDNSAGQHAAWLWLPVMPGEVWDVMRSPQDALTCDVDVHVRHVARYGNTSDTGVIGASVLLTGADPHMLASDIAAVLRARWFVPAGTRKLDRQGGGS